MVLTPSSLPARSRPFLPDSLKEWSSNPPSSESMQAVKFLAPSRLRAGRWAGGVPQAARARATAAPSVIAEQAFFMETSVVLACDGGHIRVSRIGENLSFSHHLFHRNELVIVVV